MSCSWNIGPYPVKVPFQWNYDVHKNLPNIKSQPLNNLLGSHRQTESLLNHQPPSSSTDRGGFNGTVSVVKGERTTLNSFNYWCF